MRLLKSHALLRLVNSYVIDSPQPANISYLWNFGSLLATCLIIQILTGVFLAMHYTPHVDFAFNSVEHIMRDVNAGYILRYTHANVASFFFIFVYAHIARGLFYSSYREPRTLLWAIGVIIFIVMMATAFLGYKHSPKWFQFNDKMVTRPKVISTINKTNNKKSFASMIQPQLQKRLFCSNTSPQERGSVTYNSGSAIIYNTNKSNILINFVKDNNLTPIFTYEDLHLKDTRDRVLQDTKDLSGVYLILNKITLDYYIGSASTGRFYARFTNHLIYFRGSKIVKLAVNKYKLSNFAFLILELFPEIVNKENNKKLLDLEDFYLKSMLPNYNILTEAGSSFGYKHTELDKIKMKGNYSLERRLQIGNLNKGKSLLLETKQKLREKALLIDKAKIKISEQSLLNMKKKSKPIILYNLDFTVFGQYSSITEAANSINCSIKTINRALKTEKKLLKRRFIVKYVMAQS